MGMNDCVKNTYNLLLEKINKWILKKEIKKVRLADKIGVSRQTLYDYLDGTNIIPGDIIFKFEFLMNHPEEPI